MVSLVDSCVKTGRKVKLLASASCKCNKLSAVVKSVHVEISSQVGGWQKSRVGLRTRPGLSNGGPGSGVPVTIAVVSFGLGIVVSSGLGVVLDVAVVESGDVVVVGTAAEVVLVKPFGSTK
jgi:hypothetical protein